MTTVVLFSEHFGWPDKSKYKNPLPIIPSIFRLATHLRNKNIDVKTSLCWRSPVEEFYKICKFLITGDTKVVGFSTTLTYPFVPLRKENVDDIILRCRIIKKINPNVKIVAGGSIINERHLPGEVMKPLFDYIDTFVIGRGEEFLEKILENNSTNEKILIDKEEIHHEFSNTTIEYTDQDGILPHDAIGIEFSRGCIFKCSFCNYPLLGKKPGDMVKRTSVLYDEFVKNYEERGLTYYYFTDSLLNDSLERMQYLAEVSSKLPFKLKYSAYIRLDLIRKFPMMTEYLKESGLINGIAGIETVNDESGKSVKKGLGIERINETLEIIRNKWNKTVGISGCFILGLPHDTNETVYKTIEWLSTDLVKDTILDVTIDALKLSSKEMTTNEKYEYKFSNSLEWTNRYGYTSTQAIEDCNKIYDQFYSNYEVPVRFYGFDVVQAIAYAKKYNLEKEMEKFYFDREKTPFLTSKEDWVNLRSKWHNDRVDQYIKNIFKQF